MGDHGVAVLAARGELGFKTDIQSDCAPLNGLIADLLAACPDVHVLRDPTRGGAATTLNEIARQSGMCITTLPDLHVAVVGIDKVIPDWDSLTVFLKLLARSAAGLKISTYTQFITGLRRAEGEFGPREFHLVLLDNGRSGVLHDPVGREVFKCIRCGACANVCPVYQNVGGFAYGWFISGPIGAIFTPQILGTPAARELPFASTLCGACADVCPVKIPIPAILRHLRRRVAEGDDFSAPAMPASIRAAARLSAFALAQNWIYRLGARILPLVMSVFKRGGWVAWAPYPLSRWTKVRPLPPLYGWFQAVVAQPAERSIDLSCA